MARPVGVDPAARVRFGVLGPLQVVDSSGAIRAVSAAKQRIVLAALLLADGRTVSPASLAEAVWDGSPPPNAPAVMRTYVARLRRVLGPAGARIVGRPPGWAVELDAPEEFDVAEADALWRAARAPAETQDWRQASLLLSRALSLWRGEPLVDVPSAALTRREADRLGELRLQLTEARVDADLRLGRHSEVVADLRRLAAEYPLREHIRAQLMLACYRCGQQAEALEVYRDARSTLAGELGVEPGNELREMHQRVLTADPRLTAPAEALMSQSDGDQGVQHSELGLLVQGRSGSAGSSAIDGPGEGEASAAVVPRQLPAPVACFTGRDAELAALTGLLDGQPGARVPPLVISAIGGAAGVGKTALAVRWAHQIAGRFPDGQLYVNLRGYDPGEPVLATDALAGFLRALGVPGPQIPDDAEDRARLYRTRLARRRVLVLLDNARHGEQVRPLLPGDPRCAAVVTSRDSLAGLVATDGGVRLDLDVLAPADAVGLLRSLIGNRADDDPQSAEALAELCARLPLALRIAAEQACAQPRTTLRDLVEELQRSRLDGLDGGEDRADIRAVFSWSLRRLPGDAAEAFGLTGIHPGAELDDYASAALTGTEVREARRVLDRLRRASLIQETGPGRYGMHDLLRAYAREQAAARDTDNWCRQRLTRLFDYYLAAVVAAMDIVFPAEPHHRPQVAPAAAAVPEMAGQADARAWLDRERANLVAVVVHCAGHGWPRHAAGLAARLFRYLISGSHLPEALIVYGHLLQAARRAGDLAAEATALSGLGGISIMKGHPRDAAGHLLGALERYRQCGDQLGEAKALRNLGITEKQLHNPRAAAGYHRQAVAAYQDAGDSVGAARALANLAESEAELGSYDQAEQHLQRALPVLRDAGDQAFEAQTLEELGDLHLRRGQLDQAAVAFGQALAGYRHLDHPTGASAQLCNLGEVSLRLGDCEQAISYLRQALAIFRQTGHQFGEVVTLRTLARALHGAGQPAAARAELETALRLAAETGNAYQQASIHRDLADSHHSAGQDDQARHHWQQALDLYTQLGAPEADQTRDQLDAPQTLNGVPAQPIETGVQPRQMR